MTATERVQREVDIFFQGYWEGVRTMKEQNKPEQVTLFDISELERCRND